MGAPSSGQGELTPGSLRVVLVPVRVVLLVVLVVLVWGSARRRGWLTRVHQEGSNLVYPGDSWMLDGGKGRGRKRAAGSQAAGGGHASRQAAPCGLARPGPRWAAGSAPRESPQCNSGCAGHPQKWGVLQRRSRSRPPSAAGGGVLVVSQPAAAAVSPGMSAPVDSQAQGGELEAPAGSGAQWQGQGAGRVSVDSQTGWERGEAPPHTAAARSAALG